MSDVLTLAAEMRTEFGKGFARRARMAGKIPAVLYGHGSDPVHVFLPGHETMMALKHSNALLTIMVEGKPELTIAKDIQKDYVRRTIAHLDLLIVKKGEKITVDVPLHLTGEPFPGCVAVLEHNTVSVSAEATHLPERFEISVEGLTDGQHVTAGEITLPAGSTLLTDPHLTVMFVTETRAEAAADDEDGAEAAPAAAATAE
jgi:large subunit ribosomal protein L25